jgi:hypothetical protein
MLELTPRIGHEQQALRTHERRSRGASQATMTFMSPSKISSGPAELARNNQS